MHAIYKGKSLPERFTQEKVYDVLEISDNADFLEICVSDNMNKLCTFRYNSISDCIENWKAI